MLRRPLCHWHGTEDSRVFEGWTGHAHTDKGMAPQGEQKGAKRAALDRVPDQRPGAGERGEAGDPASTFL